MCSMFRHRSSKRVTVSFDQMEHKKFRNRHTRVERNMVIVNSDSKLLIRKKVLFYLELQKEGKSYLH